MDEIITRLSDLVEICEIAVLGNWRTIRYAWPAVGPPPSARDHPVRTLLAMLDQVNQRDADILPGRKACLLRPGPDPVRALMAMTAGEDRQRHLP